MCKLVADEDDVLCVLTCIGMWEEVIVRKPVAGEDDTLYVLICMLAQRPSILVLMMINSCSYVY